MRIIKHIPSECKDGICDYAKSGMIGVSAAMIAVQPHQKSLIGDIGESPL